MTARKPTIIWLWMGLVLLMLALLILREKAAWSIVYPTAWVIPITDWLNAFMDWTVEAFGPFFRAFSVVLGVPMVGVQNILNGLPWSAVLALITLIAYAVSGVALATFTFFAMLYMVVIGYWNESMNSLALVLVSVPLAVVIGFILGTLGFFSKWANKVIAPTLDLLQTVPAFAYLLPILLLFGFGPVVGLIASVLYAFPPMVRNTILGFKRVSPEIVESGLMSGATNWQLFWKVRVPGALKQILLGVNQATMAAFSMVIIASIIGGTADIGWEVLSTMRKAQFGESLLAGIVIALMAMVMDRITAAAAAETDTQSNSLMSEFGARKFCILAAAVTLALVLLAQLVPLLKSYPEAWELYPAEYLNDAVTFIVVEYAGTIALVKSWAFFYLMLPLKIGLEKTISPFSWGFEFTTAYKWTYAMASVVLLAVVTMRKGMGVGVFLAFLAILFFFGLTRLPWPALIAMVSLLAWQMGGIKLAIGSAVSLVFLLVAGVWPQTLLSVYLCGIAVVLSFVLGTLLGILAAEFKPVSSFLQPINDTLQTMPLFVILIPFVMIFKLGEFTALLAVMAYAIVPAIRYAEHGLRSVSVELIEASAAIGCTPWQQLWRVKLPIALPVIMLGLNQTIMYGIAMLVIAALVGTSGLGQQVYIGLGDGDFGVGIVAGIGMAIIAMIADRMTQAWSKTRQAAFGLQ